MHHRHGLIFGENRVEPGTVGQRAFARALIERAGVDVVHGHSSHHPLGFEVHRGRPILYGCGDLINDYEGIRGHEEYRGDLGLLWFLDFDLEPDRGRLAALTMAPLRNRRQVGDQELACRIAEGFTLWRWEDGREGLGMTEYIEFLEDGEPAGYPL